MLKTKVKASSITHLTDARYFAAWEVEWLGFYLSPGDEASLEPTQVSAMREWVDGVKVCGEFGLPTPEEAVTAVDVLPLDVVQVGMLTPLDTIRAIAERCAVLQEIVVEGYSQPDALREQMAANDPHVEAFLLNFSKGGITWADLEAGTPFGLDQLRYWTADFPILLDISLGEDADPAQIADDFQLYGYSIRGSEEEKVGFKSFDEIDDFFDALQVEE